MDSLTHDPVLGHINTFGGHPVCCAAGLAAFEVLLNEKIIATVYEKQKLFLSLLQHPKIKAVRSRGLMIAVELESFEMNKKLIDALINSSEEVGVFTDWFLFAPGCLRIAPPLTISTEEIKKACHLILAGLS